MKIGRGRQLKIVSRRRVEGYPGIGYAPAFNEYYFLKKCVSGEKSDII